MSIRSIICVYLATVTVTLAVSRQVRINPPNSNTIEATPQEILQEAEPPGNASYEFAYDVNDPLSNDVKSHREIRDGENVYGYYTFKEADGSTRIVNYKVGPKTGFEATVERLEIGERPEIKRPVETSTQALQEARDNVQRVDQQRRIRGRAQTRVSAPAPTRSPYIEPQRVTTFQKPPGVQVNQHVQATAPEYEYYTYIQDEKPLRGSPADDIQRRPKPTVSELPTSNSQSEQDWKNSILGRKHIRQQIALLAKKKEEEEAQKAAIAKQTQTPLEKTTLVPITEAAETSPLPSPPPKQEEKPESQQEKEAEREEEEDKSFEDDDDFDDFPDHDDEEEDDE